MFWTMTIDVKWQCAAVVLILFEFETPTLDLLQYMGGKSGPQAGWSNTHTVDGLSPKSFVIFCWSI